MKKLKINICAPLFEPSGYGEFARGFVYALHKNGAELSLQDIALQTKHGDYGAKQELCKKLLKLPKANCDYNVVFMVAPLFSRFKKKGAKNIGFTMWEADRLPDKWVEDCNAMDAVFVPSNWNKEVFEASGVKVPVYVVQPGLELEHERTHVMKKNNEFVFGSVFQWTERKNPRALLKAYLTHFSNKDNVTLKIKTYGSASGQSIIQMCENFKNETISDLKADPLSVPKVEFITEILTHKQVSEFYDCIDALVASHRGEGWGLPLMEAMLRGKEVIATDFSANKEFMTQSNSWLIPYQLTPAVGMGNYVPWINGTMWWADVDVKKLGEAMVSVFHGAKKGNIAEENIRSFFNFAKSAESFERALLSQR
jgi:glycosyltransferase involved in cell wall biosynthesis